MSGGVGAALDQVIEARGAAEIGDQAVQAVLFEADQLTGAGNPGAPSPLSAALPVKAGPGRRPGSKNKRTQAVADWLLTLHRSPLAVMAEAYSMAPGDFLRQAGFAFDAAPLGAPDGAPCSVYSNGLLLEAVKLQLRMAEAVAPYVHQRQPLAVQMDARAAVQLSIAGVSLPARGLVSEEAAGLVEGEVMGVRLPKSDEASRTDG